MIDIRPIGLMTHIDIVDRQSIEAEANRTIENMSIDELSIYINELQKLQTHARFVELIATKRKHKIIAELPSNDPRITKVKAGVSGIVTAERPKREPESPEVKAKKKLDAMIAQVEALTGRKMTDEEKAKLYGTEK